MAAIQSEERSQPVKTRRRLLFFLPTVPLIAAAASWLSPRSGRSRSNTGIDTKVATRDAIAIYEARACGRQLLNTYPQPQWLPEDFQVRFAVACSSGARSRQGMFLGIDDEKQLHVSARRRSARTHADHINTSLSIHVAPAERMPAIRGADAQPGEPVILRTSDGQTLHGEYYGPRRPSHLLGGAHSIALYRDGFAILVASFHKNGLTRAQLERVAASMRRS
jgi:hypothetical protein